MNFKAKIEENNLNAFNVHDHLQYLPVDEIRKHQVNNNFALCLINILGDLNIGTMVRSAVIFGATKVYIAGRRRFDKRSSVGAHNYIDIEHIDAYDLDTDQVFYDKILEKLEKDNWETVCCETEGIPIQDFSAQKRKKYPCFIMGSEGFGIPDQVLERADECVTIPQFGVMRSLNVASAASIIMYEYTRLKDKND